MVNGELFWSHGKLCPTPLDYSYDIAIEFIESTANMFCYIYNIVNINNDFDKNTIIKYISNAFVSEYNITDKRMAATEEEAKELAELEKIKESSLEYSLDIDNIINKLNPIIFEKDDDMHVRWLSSASNCRATNYNIPNVSIYETKGIAGRIIPAVATTTSTVVGLISIELLKYINSIDKIEKYRSWFLNMADNTVLYSEPNPIAPIIIDNKSMNGWTKFKYNKDALLNEFIEYYNKLFDVKIEMILYGSAIVYADFMETHYNTKLFDIFLKEYEINIFENEIVLTLISNIYIPNINVLLTL